MFARIIYIQRAFRNYIKAKKEKPKPIKQNDIKKNSISIKMSLRQSVSSNVSLMKSISFEMCDESINYFIKINIFK
jgi:hypothetical protein